MEKDWICVYQTEHDFQAEIARELLENEEIDCVVMNEHDSALPSIGNFELWVHKNFQEAATKILKDLIV